MAFAVGVHVPGAERVIRRTRHHEVKARPGSCFWSPSEQVPLNDGCSDPPGRCARGCATQRGQPRLQLDQRHLGRGIVLARVSPDYADACAQIDQAPERRWTDKVGEQQRIDAEAAADLG